MAETAQRRYRLRRDTMFSESPQGIYFSNSTSGFEICGANAYRAFRAVYPLLDGEYTEDELREMLGVRAWERLQAFIIPLRKHGYLRLIDPCADVVLDGSLETRFEDQLNFLAHYTDEPRRVFSRFRSTQLAVVGDGECARAVVRALTDNGAGDVRLVLPTADQRPNDADLPGEVRTVHSDPRTDHEALRGADVIILTPCAASSDLLLHGVDEEPDRLVVPVWAFGDELFVGPVNWSGSGTRTPRWADAVQALTACDAQSSATSLFWSRAWAGLPTGGEATWVPALERMIAVIAAFEVFKAVTGVMKPETGGAALALNCQTGETRRYRVFPSRKLRTAPARKDRLVEMARAASTGLEQPTSEPSRVTPEELDAYTGLVGPRTRPVSEFLDDDLEQLPLKVSIARLVDGPEGPIDVGGADLWNVAGARLTALRRALALHLEYWAPTRGNVPEHPLISSLDSRLRNDLEPGGPNVPAVDVVTNETVAVSAAATATLSPTNGAGIYRRSCGGTGVGSDVDRAVSDALASAAVEVALQATTGRAAGKVIPDWDTDEQTAFLHACTQDLNLEPELIDLGTWLGRRVVLARIQSPAGSLWEVAAAGTLHDAIVLALIGVVGALQRNDGAETWTSLSHPGLSAASIAVSEGEPPSVAGVPRVLVCDVTTPELDAVGLVACKILTADVIGGDFL